MRVLMVLLALVAMPLAAGVAQEEPSDNPGVRHAWARGHDKDNKCDNDDRSDARRADRKGDDDDRQCADPAPSPSPTPPPSPCTPPAPLSGGATISGTVVNGWGGPGLGCWTVTAYDGTNTFTTVTTTAGSYSLSVPGSATPTATYAVCAVVQSGWHQVWPGMGMPAVCGMGGFGYQFPLIAGNSAPSTIFVMAVGP